MGEIGTKIIIIIMFLPEKASLKEEVATIAGKEALYYVSHKSI